MSFFIGLLTVILVLDCLLLILLVLIQLPKKEAGAGLAFGGGATDALFGAGSGNALTKITKFATVFFFVLALLVSYLQSRQRSGGVSDLERRLSQGGGASMSAPPAGNPPPAPATTPNNAPALPATSNSPAALPTPPPAN